MQYPWQWRLIVSLIALSAILSLCTQAQEGKQDGEKADGLKPVTYTFLFRTAAGA
jgi:hypothetical protein